MKLQSRFIIKESRALNRRYQLIVLEPGDDKGAQLLDEPGSIKPGQFMQILIPGTAGTFLRRPISICDATGNQLTLLVARAGNGTETLCNLTVGTQLDIVWPLGNGFSIPAAGKRVLLMGGGVGTAPLLYYSKKLKEAGVEVEVVLAARTAADILLADEIAAAASVHIATDDGTAGHHGLITTHPAFTDRDYDLVATCGPRPMMRAIAHICDQRHIDCEVSLENVMACGIGACLCCVEKTNSGNKCVCTEGPVFKSTQLTW